MAETHTVGFALKKYDTGDNPGAANLNWNWDAIDTRLVGLGSSFPLIWPVTGLFLRTDQQKLYENTGTVVAPVWTLRLQSGGGGGGAAFVEDEFVATPGQVDFTLSQPFLAGGLSVVSVCGVLYAEGSSYTIAGTNLHWLNIPFPLAAGDDIIVKYQI